MTEPIRTGDSHGSVLRWVGLLAGIATVSALHYATPPEHALLHGIYQRAYYVPVILAAYWFGARGGVAAALASSIAYAPHIHNAWSHNPPYTVSQYAELIVFLALGIAVGLITSHERRLSNQYRETAESLERANRELRESTEQLRRAERLSALGEIAAGLAHELRNPLAGVKGAVEIVSSRSVPGTPEAEFSAIATHELRRLEGLVQEFLDFARPKTPRIRLADIRDVIVRVGSLLNAEAERTGVRLVVEPGRNNRQLPMDPEQIEQVLVNIVLNAIQASPPGGTVHVQSGSEPARCVIEVADQGPGIPAEARSRIFEPFFTTKERGTGLGLAISQRIVNAHRGEIDVASADGDGTRVRIRLPLSPGGGAHDQP